MSWLSKLFGGNSRQQKLQMFQNQQLQQQLAEQTAQTQQALQQQADQLAAQQAMSAAEIAEARRQSTEQLAAFREASAAQLEEANRVAEAAQTAAKDANYRASQTPADSEDARVASEQRIKKLLSQRGFASTILSPRSGGEMGMAPVGTKMLMGG